jgi:hypothetical protein
MNAATDNESDSTLPATHKSSERGMGDKKRWWKRLLAAIARGISLVAVVSAQSIVMLVARLIDAVLNSGRDRASMGISPLARMVSGLVCAGVLHVPVGYFYGSLLAWGVSLWFLAGMVRSLRRTTPRDRDSAKQDSAKQDSAKQDSAKSDSPDRDADPPRKAP